MELIIIACLILLNGVLAMSELAVVSARKSKLGADAKKGGRLARTALALANNPERFLSTVQVGITLIGILTGLYSGEVLAKNFDDVLMLFGLPEAYAYSLAQFIIVVVVTYMTIVFGELVPKRIGMCAPETVSKLISMPMKALSLAAAPFVWILSKSTQLIVNMLGLKFDESKVTEEEIRSMVEEGANGGEIQAVERNIVERVFNLGDRNLESIMTPRVEIVCIDVNMEKEAMIGLINKQPYGKYPVVDRSLNRLKGVVYVRELTGRIGSDSFDIMRFVREPVYFSGKMSVYGALEELKARHLTFALVCDEFGEIEGIVSLKDILEALVGEMPNSHEDTEIVVRADGSVLVDGQCSFYDFLAHFKREDLYPEYKFNTVNGLLLSFLGHVPATGEILEWNGFVFEVVDMDGVRIDKVLVTRNELDEPDAEPEE